MRNESALARVDVVSAAAADGRTPLALLACWLVITTAWWMLALAPVAAPPAWLAMARSVCFGTTLSGLPDTYGWLVLAAAPATMLVAIVVAWRDALLGGLAWMSGSVAGRVALAVVCVWLVGGVTAATARIADGLAIENIRYAPDELGALPDDYPRLGLPVPAFSLVDQDGRSFRTEDLQGSVTLLTFAFAHCHTICPAIVQTMRRTATQLGPDLPQIAIVTLDPWRDTPSRLSQMHADWEMPASVRVLSGEVGEVTRALDGFHVPWTRNEATGDVTHPALVYAIGADGKIAYGFQNPPVEWLADAARRLRAETAVASR